MARIVRLGFETRVEVVLDDGTDTWVQLAGRAFDELGVTLGQRVFVSLEHARDFSAALDSPAV